MEAQSQHFAPTCLGRGRGAASPKGESGSYCHIFPSISPPRINHIDYFLNSLQVHPLLLRCCVTTSSSPPLSFPYTSGKNLTCLYFHSRAFRCCTIGVFLRKHSQLFLPLWTFWRWTSKILGVRLGYSSVVEQLPSMYGALGLIPIPNFPPKKNLAVAYMVLHNHYVVLGTLQTAISEPLHMLLHLNLLCGPCSYWCCK